MIGRYTIGAATGDLQNLFKSLKWWFGSNLEVSTHGSSLINRLEASKFDVPSQLPEKQTVPVCCFAILINVFIGMQFEVPDWRSIV